MTTLETLGCQQYMTENDLFGVAGRLNERLHALEGHLNRAQAQVHRLLRESGMMPIEERTILILDELQALCAYEGLPSIASDAERVAALKTSVASLEAEIDREMKARSEQRASQRQPAA